MKTLTRENILLDVPSEDKMAAIRRLGQQLVDNGYVDESYIEGMIARENSLSTYVGNGVAIPHGMPEYVKFIKHSGIVMAQYRNGIDFGGGNTATLLIAIAGIGEDHMDALSSFAMVCQEEANVAKLVHSNDADEILRFIASEGIE